MSPEPHDYLRAGEFRRWADGVDRTLVDLTETTKAHGEVLAVVRDRMEQDAVIRGERRRLWLGLIGTGASSLLALAIQAWHYFTAPK